MPFVKPTAATRFRIDNANYATVSPNGTGILYRLGGDRESEVPFTWHFDENDKPIIAGNVHKKAREAILKSMFVAETAKDRLDVRSRAWRAESGIARSALR